MSRLKPSNGKSMGFAPMKGTVTHAVVLTAAVKKPAVSGTPVMAAQYWLPPRKVLGLPESPPLLGEKLKPMSSTATGSPISPTKNSSFRTSESRGTDNGAPGMSAVLLGKTT